MPLILSLFFNMLLKYEFISSSCGLKEEKNLESTYSELSTIIMLWYQFIALGIKN